MASNNQSPSTKVADELTALYEDFDQSVRKAKEAVDFLMIQAERTYNDMRKLKDKLDLIRATAGKLRERTRRD